MENKPQNLFDKLDKQSEQIEDISKKLEGVSINDLYALAKRTWDYGDYQTAQKYYNHISLLCPLDWEASLYASLCNFRGYNSLDFYINVPYQLEKIYISTIKYIYCLSLDNNKKEIEMSKCLEIIKNDINVLKLRYFEYENDFKKYDKNDLYLFSLQKVLFNLYEILKDVKFDSINIYSIYFSKELLELINKTKKYSSIINKENYNELIDFTSKNSISKPKSNTLINYLSYEEINGNKLNKSNYINLKIPKKTLLKKITVGFLLIIFSIIGSTFCFLNEKIYSLLFIFSFLYGASLIIYAFIIKYKIKNTFNFTIIINKNVLKFLKISSYIGLYLQILFFILLNIELAFTNINFIFKLLIIICAVISSLVYLISILINLKKSIKELN